MSEDREGFVREYVKKDRGLYYFCRAIMVPLAYLFYRPRFYNKEKIPQTGPVILASNHIHLCDPVFVIMSTKRLVRYLAKKELHDSAMGPLYKAMHTIPVDRQKDSHNSIYAAEWALEENEVIGIFPEGTRNRLMKEELLPFKYGTVAIARDSGAPIVPIALRSKGRPLIDRYEIVIGDPYPVAKDADLSIENEKLYEKIRELLHFDAEKISE